MRYKSQRSGPLAGRAKELNCGAPNGFIKALPQILAGPPGQPATAAPVLYATIGTWQEADVIEASVKNCLANGCSKVFIIDNASADDTCKAAIAAGAVIAKVYQTAYYDDDLRVRLTNEVIAAVTIREQLPNLWWLSIDADEFPCGPRGERILDYLDGLDARATCMGAYAVDLYPTEPPHYTPGMHPADCQSMGLHRKGSSDIFCTVDHWKHPLQRYQYGRFDMAQSRGFHIPFVATPTTNPALLPQEPADTLILFHAPYRGKEATWARLELLCTKQDELGGHHRSAGDDTTIGPQGAVKRWRSLKAVYDGHWDKVELPHSQLYGRDIVGIALYPWRKLLPRVQTFPRWYNLAVGNTAGLDRISLL